ncbi:hypothetical protein [Capnocytophaga gingivalis]|jgi:putative membrane protein|uniref:O-antigen polymerase n=1 Tax=Capnocytophaga gingivalis TaxID=1017 RepID=A0ABU5Y6R8_9FLAO|nr:hypothetical protein [Capnocytophaga gingivalis]MEB3039591.1 hypothetical protein [Capnocytophaga gingivalis]
MFLKIEIVNKYIFYLLFIIFFILPEALQKIFRIGLGLFFMYYAYVLIYNHKISSSSIIKIHLLIIALILVILNGSYQSSVINVILCTFGVFIIKEDTNIHSYKDEKLFNFLYNLSIISMILQILIFRTDDGRPNLSYEINLSGAYLFLFFLLSILMKKKRGIIFVFLASLLLLSRLLIFAIVLYYILIYIKKFLPDFIFKINFKYIYILLTILFFIFSFWFLTNIKIGSSYKTDSSRITELNDSSNKLRFMINSKVIIGLFIEKDEKLKFGYGQITKGNSLEYTNKYGLMPHNELLMAIAEYGYIFTCLCFLFIISIYNNFFDKRNIIIIAPLLLYTFILWVRFLIVPSFEMIFILYLLKFNSIGNEKNSIFGS